MASVVRGLRSDVRQRAPLARAQRVAVLDGVGPAGNGADRQPDSAGRTRPVNSQIARRIKRIRAGKVLLPIAQTIAIVVLVGIVGKRVQVHG